MAYLTKLVQSLEKFPPSSSFCLGILIYRMLTGTLWLIGVNVTKAHGPDGISARMLREAAPDILESLTNLFNFSLQSGTLPVEWRSAHVIPVFKKG